jgi:hypothetical protein
VPINEAASPWRSTSRPDGIGPRTLPCSGWSVALPAADIRLIFAERGQDINLIWGTQTSSHTGAKRENYSATSAAPWLPDHSFLQRLYHV